MMLPGATHVDHGLVHHRNWKGLVLCSAVLREKRTKGNKTNQNRKQRPSGKVDETREDKTKKRT